MDIEFSRQRALRTRDLPEKADPFTRKHPALAERYDEKAGGPLNASPMIDRPAPLAREWSLDGRAVGRGMKKPKADKAATEVKYDAWTDRDRRSRPCGAFQEAQRQMGG